MPGKTAIQWATDTWNPTTGCDRVSPGCANCYALTRSARNKAMAIGSGKHVLPTDPYMRDGDPKTSGPGFGFQMHESRLDWPLHKKKPLMVFVNSMSDLWHEEMDYAFLDKIFAVMALAPQHVFQVLTKRPERMLEYMTDPDREYRVGSQMQGLFAKGEPRVHVDWPLPNVWMGTSVENARWRTRIDYLRQVPAAVRFLSCEPLLGPLVCPSCKGWGYDVDVDTKGEPHQVPCRTGGAFGGHDHDLDLKGIDWVIVGGESGAGAREMDPDWVREIGHACARQDVAFFVKQMGHVWSEENLGHGGHGGEIETFPADLKVREYPDAWHPNGDASGPLTLAL